MAVLARNVAPDEDDRLRGDGEQFFTAVTEAPAGERICVQYPVGRAFLPDRTDQQEVVAAVKEEMVAVPALLEFLPGALQFVEHQVDLAGEFRDGIVPACGEAGGSAVSCSDGPDLHTHAGDASGHIPLLEPDPEYPEDDADDEDPGEQDGWVIPGLARKAGREGKESREGRAGGTGAHKEGGTRRGCVLAGGHAAVSIQPGRGPLSCRVSSGSPAVFGTAVPARSPRATLSHDGRGTI